MKTASVAEVKARFSEFLKISEQGPVVVTRNGKAVAVLTALMDEDDLERLKMAHSPGLQAILAAAEKRFAEGKGIPEEQFWAQVEKENEVKKRGRRAKPVDRSIGQ